MVGQRVLAVADDDHAAHGLGALLVQGAAALSAGPATTVATSPMVTGMLSRTVITLFSMSSRLFEEAEAADHVLDAVDLDGPGAHVHVGLPDRLEDLVQAHPEGPHGVGIHVDLVLADEAADRGDLGHALGRQQGVAHVPVLDAAQLVQIPAAGGIAGLVAALEGVPEDLAQGGGVGPEGGLHALRAGCPAAGC